jgi:nitrous oxidase accessory protein NosD
VRYNYCWGNKRAGIEIDAMNNSQVYGNLVVGNGHWGINAYADWQTSMTGQQIYNNTVYDNVGGGIKVEGPTSGEVAGGCTNNLVKNNISSGNVSGPNLTARLGCENPGADGSGNVYTYNELGTQASSFLQWGESLYSTYAAWEAAAGNCGTTGCSHSTQTTPTLANAAGGQFWLTSGSPGIDAGTNLGVSVR